MSSLREMLLLSRPAPTRPERHHPTPAGTPTALGPQQPPDEQSQSQPSQQPEQVVEQPQQSSSADSGTQPGRLGSMRACLAAVSGEKIRAKRRIETAEHKMEKVRLKSQITQLTQKDKVAPHTAKQLQKINNNAKTPNHLVDLNSKRPVKVKGRGQWRKWLPGPIQRVCFGNASTEAKGDGGTLSGAVSTRVLSDFFESSHAHVRNLRSCVALALVVLQKALLWSLAEQMHIIWICSCDETEALLTAEQVKSKHHLMMMHFVLYCRTALMAPLLSKNFVCAPAVIHNTKAESLLNALKLRAPMPFMGLASKARRSILVLNTDSANSCKSISFDIVGRLLEFRKRGEATFI